MTTENTRRILRQTPLKNEAGRPCAGTQRPALDRQPSNERMKIMATHTSASMREEAPHATETIQITISDALRRRAQSIIYDSSIDPQWCSIVRYALETNDPWLAKLVRRAEAGETIVDSDGYLNTTLMS